MNVGDITHAACRLGELREMTVQDIEANLTALEDGVVRQLQVTLAICLTHDICV